MHYYLIGLRGYRLIPNDLQNKELNDHMYTKWDRPFYETQNLGQKTSMIKIM